MFNLVPFCYFLLILGKDPGPVSGAWRFHCISYGGIVQGRMSCDVDVFHTFARRQEGPVVTSEKVC